MDDDEEAAAEARAEEAEHQVFLERLADADAERKRAAVKQAAMDRINQAPTRISGLAVQV